MKVLFVYANLEMSSMVPLGLASLSGYIKQYGHETSVFDTTFFKTGKNENIKRSEIGQVLNFNFDEIGVKLENEDVFVNFRNDVLRKKPDLIALSIVEDTFNLGINLLNSVKDLNIPNIVGGVFPTFASEIVIAEDCVDIVATGEGEKTLLEVCNAIEKNISLKNINNILYIENNDVVKNPTGPLVELDEIPIPDYDIWPKKMLYRPMQGKIRLTVGIETQRGCPFTCAFCNSPSQNDFYKKEIGKKYHRRKSIRKIKKELDYLTKKFKPELIYWVADTFLAMPEYEWDEFHEMYLDYKIPFWMNTRIETITKKRIKQLEEMNALRFNIGIEHGYYQFRKEVILRRTTNERLIKQFKVFEGYSVPVVANIIIGYPGEDEKLIRDSIEFVRKIAPYFDAIQVFIFAPYHGTPLRTKSINEGYLKGDEIVNAGLISGSILDSPHWTNERLKSIQRTFPLYVKLPKKYHADILRAENFDEKGQNIFNDLVEIYRTDYMKKEGSSSHKLDIVKEDLIQ